MNFFSEFLEISEVNYYYEFILYLHWNQVRHGPLELHRFDFRQAKIQSRLTVLIRWPELVFYGLDSNNDELRTSASTIKPRVQKMWSKMVLHYIVRIWTSLVRKLLSDQILARIHRLNYSIQLPTTWNLAFRINNGTLAQFSG